LADVEFGQPTYIMEADMYRQTNANPSERGLEAVVDAQDLRAVISGILATRPLDAQALRRGVWTYVGAERAAGTTPERIVEVLVDLVDGAEIIPVTAYQALTRDVTRWCVEAHFGHLGDDLLDATVHASSSPRASTVTSQ
jgi:hypothetical protein